jgi:hypothetical protein
VSVFALGLDAILADPSFGEDALWKASGSGPGVPVRVVRRAPDEIERFGDSRALLGSVVVEMRRADAPTLAESDVVEIGGTTFRVIADPNADALGLSFTVELAPL